MDDGEGFLGISFTLLGQKPSVDRDEGDRGRASGDDVVQEIRKGEGSDVGIGLGSRAESIGDIGLARVSNDARRHNCAHQQKRRGKSRVRCDGRKKRRNLVIEIR